MLAGFPPHLRYVSTLQCEKLQLLPISVASLHVRSQNSSYQLLLMVRV